jgi:hypothetical protein
MEVLTVLIIVGLVSAVVFQGFEMILRLDRSTYGQVEHARERAMLVSWFRQSIEGLQADFPGGRHGFSGASARLSGQSGNQLSDAFGAVAPIAWEIVYEQDTGATQLRYAGGRETSVLVAWPNARGRFVYLDDKGDRHDSWPPPLGRWPQIPEAVLLEVGEGANRETIVARPMGAKQPGLRPGGLFGAR